MSQTRIQASSPAQNGAVRSRETRRTAHGRPGKGSRLWMPNSRSGKRCRHVKNKLKRKSMSWMANACPIALSIPGVPTQCMPGRSFQHPSSRAYCAHRASQKAWRFGGPTSQHNGPLHADPLVPSHILRGCCLFDWCSRCSAWEGPNTQLGKREDAGSRELHGVEAPAGLGRMPWLPGSSPACFQYMLQAETYC